MTVLVTVSATAQGFLKFERDSIPFFQGISVGVDVAGALQMQLSDYGQYEAALKVNLHDQYFPTLEVGYGKASHEDDVVTGISYHTKAPYFRIGADVNMMKKKHTGNRIFVGLRYAFTSYKVDIIRENLPDPVWQNLTGFSVEGMPCSQHWLEAVLGLDAKIIGPLHLGWSVRYKRRLAHKDGDIGQTWYVPGFGISDKDNLAATFNVIIDI